MATPNQDPSKTPEISTDQMDEFIKAVRSHLDPAQPSYISTEPTKPPSLDELKEQFPKLDDDELSRMWQLLYGGEDEDTQAEPNENVGPQLGTVELYSGAYFM